MDLCKELTRENVYTILQDCKVTPKTKTKQTLNFYSKESKDQGYKAPLLTFDGDKVGKNYFSIIYMLGQLQCVHQKKDYMFINNGFIDYKGKKWTEDQMAVLSLFYLGVASCSMPPFFPNIQGGTVSPIGTYKGLVPTYSPNDPAFPSWWEKNKKFWEPRKKGGQEPADD